VPTAAKTVNEDLLTDFEATGKYQFRVYEPREVLIVMGAGRKAEWDIHLQQARADGIPVLRRRGGGGSVVLSPGQVVLALVTEVGSPFRNLEYFRDINGWFRDVLASLGVENIQNRGISDLALGERKILGTSLYRRRRVLFYQASLLVENDLGLFSRYLTFPNKIPDYRQNRDHLEFCTNLVEAGYPLSAAQLFPLLEKKVRFSLPRLV